MLMPDMHKSQDKGVINVLFAARAMHNSSATSLQGTPRTTSSSVKLIKSKEQLQQPVEPPPKHAKRVTFSKQRKVAPTTPQTTVKETEVQTGLTSCLITNSTMEPRVPGGANNPAERRVGWLARTDSECQFKAPGIEFLTERDTNVTTFEVKMRDSVQSVKDYTTKCDYFPKFVDRRPFKDQATQTLYRESSAQTLAYLPNIMDKEEDENLELFKLSKLLPGDKPPGLYEVEILERARKRWAFNAALKTNFMRQLHEERERIVKSKYKPILEAFEWEQWIEREEHIQECQMMRLEIVIRMFDKREREMHTASKTRIEVACTTIEKRRQRGLTKNEVEYQRAMRRLEIKNAGISRRWKKQSPMYALGSPCSEFYGPLMRHGVDPARRSFVGDGRKAFDMRIDDLEKRVNMDQLQCPFTKLKEWSKPKEYVKEYEQNFCSDKHLQKLYESLKTLRTQATKPKTTPKCLKRRPKPPSEIDERVSYNYEYTDARDFFKDRLLRRTVESTHSMGLTREQQLAIQHHITDEEWRQRRPDISKELLKERRHEDLEQLLHMYEGSTIGWIMQFLSEEMERLKEQRKLHFFSILAQKERWRREAAEAGLRQKENDMRLLYEEMFQQSNVVHNEIAEEYINTIMTTDMTHIAEGDATDSIVAIAKEIDKDIQRWLTDFQDIQSPANYERLRQLLGNMVFPNLSALLSKYENTLIIRYIVDDVIFPGLWDDVETYDIAHTIANDLIDRTIDNDLYLFSTDSESDAPHDTSWVESKAIIRKVIRQAVPGRRWKTEIERITIENYNDLLDDVFMKIFDAMNADPPISEPIVLRPVISQRGITIEDNIRLIEELCRLDSLEKNDYVELDDTSLLRYQILSLHKKLKNEKITKELRTDELYLFSEDTVKETDLLMKKETINEAHIEKFDQLDVISVLNTLDMFKTEDLTVYRGKIHEVKRSSSTIDTQTQPEDQLIGMLHDIVSTDSDDTAVDHHEITTEYEADDESSWWNRPADEGVEPTIRIAEEKVELDGKKLKREKLHKEEKEVVDDDIDKSEKTEEIEEMIKAEELDKSDDMEKGEEMEKETEVRFGDSSYRNKSITGDEGQIDQIDQDVASKIDLLFDDDDDDDSTYAKNDKHAGSYFQSKLGSRLPSNVSTFDLSSPTTAATDTIERRESRVRHTISGERD